MNQVKLIDKKEIAVQLKGLVKAIRMTTERVQTLATQAIAYSIVHKDASVATDLFQACSTNKSLRKDSLVKHMEQLGHLAFDTKDKQFKFLINAKINGKKVGVLTPEHEAIMLAHRWDEAKPEPKIISEYDMEAQVRAFIGKMQKIVADTGITVKNKDALAIVEQTFARWSAENTLRAMTPDQDVLDESARQQAVADAKAALPVIVMPEVKVAA